MRRRQSMLVLGVWLMVLPFLGFRSSWKTSLFVLTGFVISCVYVYQRSYGKECTCRVEKEKMRGEIFVDNRDRVIPQA